MSVCSVVPTLRQVSPESSDERRRRVHAQPTKALAVFPNHHLMKLVAEAHREDLRHAADRSRLARAAKNLPERSVENLEVPITIRPARPADASALAKLAELDSADVPSVPVLIAEANGELRAAVSLYDGAAIADPFTHTTWVVQLLYARAAQLRGHGRVHRRHFLRTLTRRRRWAM